LRSSKKAEYTSDLRKKRVKLGMFRASISPSQKQVEMQNELQVKEYFLGVVSECVESFLKLTNEELEIWASCKNREVVRVLDDADLKVEKAWEKSDALIIWKELFGDLKYGTAVEEMLS
jgi:hypothetical protein